MRLIYKYQLRGAGSGPIQMPKGAEVLCAREQQNMPCVWAVVDPHAETEQRLFLAAETGKISIPEDSRYLGTCLLDGGAYVLHIFEPIKSAI